MAMRVGRPGRHRRLKLADIEPRLLEKEIQWEIIKALRGLGFDVTSLSQPRETMQTEGIPDLYVRHAAWGMRVWVEVKRPGREPSAAQLAWHEAERSAGGLVIVATSALDCALQLSLIRERRS